MEQPLTALRPGPVTRPENVFTQPLRQLVVMALVILLVVAGSALAWPHLWPLFMAKKWLNGFITLAFLVGVATCFASVIRLMQSITWIEAFVQRRGVQSEPPGMLLPLANMLRSRSANSRISATSSRSILDSVGARLDESREVSHYLSSLLIFLGLLGTFYGLATTVPALVETIRSLAPQEGTALSGTDVMSGLMSGLQAQLGGMGTAFSSSLLGLAGSLVVGLLALFASHSQTRFHQELEEWLSSITRLGVADGDEGGVTGVLDLISQQMDELRDIFAESEAGRRTSDDRAAHLSDQIGRLLARGEQQDQAHARLAEAQTAALSRIADGQGRMADAMEVSAAKDAPHADAEYRSRLRSIDNQLLRLLEELAVGRQETTAELRADLAQLTHTLRQAAKGEI
ncbi:biopolymer transporter ExbB [Falsirhodobacter sp. 20TX0035]|uniref:biopolymer transporter ExbB n=1 Tax=Falsirhodobacter sp. 20TX0035 TaxID=3022019 RepID=UPI00232D1B94|nr:biopolymer transporter ExbB [Falsirhodobacter sp. 20TX0035]MDB6453819.1 biopolymer transporter ExbB [Falsirhodobacter sp. 20TX0035]